jgi:hypothetical protein
MDPPLATPETTLAIILGAKEWPKCPKKARTPDVFDRSYRRIRDYLLKEAGGFGLPEANLKDLFNSDASQIEIGDAIKQFLKEHGAKGSPTFDVLVYYIGHGFPSDKTLFLLLRSSEEDDSRVCTCLSIADLAKTLKEDARNLRQYVIIDACHAGDALRAPWHSTEGVALLCSSSAEDQSWAPIGDNYTLFTGALIDALTNPELDGEVSVHAKLSLSQVKERARKSIEKCSRSKISLPEVHSPVQTKGNPADLPLFPRPGARSELDWWLYREKLVREVEIRKMESEIDRKQEVLEDKKKRLELKRVSTVRSAQQVAQRKGHLKILFVLAVAAFLARLIFLNPKLEWPGFKYVRQLLGIYQGSSDGSIKPTNRTAGEKGYEISP